MTPWLDEQAGSAHGWTIDDMTYRRYQNESGRFEPAPQKSSTYLGVNGRINPVPTGGGHCEPTHTRELWRGTLRTAEYTRGGRTFVGYRRASSEGALSPDTFAWRTATVRIHTVNRTGTVTNVGIERSAGSIPADGALGDGRFRFVIGTGSNTHVLAIENPGTDTALTFPNAAFSWTDGQTVPMKLLVNVGATGKPTIDGTARTGETLTATVAGIADVNGLDADTFSYQWILVEIDATETEIDGATKATYTQNDDDLDKTVKVKVSFTDDHGFAESVTSDEFLASESVDDTTIPSLTSATIDATALTLTYDEELDTGSVPAKAQFTVKVNGVATEIETMTNVEIAGKTETVIWGWVAIAVFRDPGVGSAR